MQINSTIQNLDNSEDMLLKILNDIETFVGTVSDHYELLAFP